MIKILSYLCFLSLPFGVWPLGLSIPLTPSNFFWTLILIFLFIERRSINTGIYPLSIVVAYTIAACLGSLLSPFEVDTNYVASSVFLVTTTVLVFPFSNIKLVGNLLLRYINVSVFFMLLFWLNHMLYFVSNTYFNIHLLSFEGIRNSSLFTEPHHYYAATIPLSILVFLQIKQIPKTQLTNPEDAFYKLSTSRYYKICSILSILSIPFGSALTSYLYFGISLSLVLFLRGYTLSSLFKLNKINVMQARFPREYLLPILILLIFALYFIIDFARILPSLSITGYKILSIFDYDVYNSTSGLSFFAIVSNADIAYKALTDSIIGFGLGSYPSLAERYSSLATDGAVLTSNLLINSDDGSSLYIRLLAELGIIFVAIFFILLFRFASFSLKIRRAYRAYKKYNLEGYSSIHSITFLYSCAVSLIVANSIRVGSLQSTALLLAIVFVFTSSNLFLRKSNAPT